MRVSMSAIGSVTFIGSPARLRDARQVAQQGALPEADAAQRKAADVAARAPAHDAAVIGANREALVALRLGDHRLLGHGVWFPPPVSRRTACRGARAGA